jgi:hypothetical protein
LVFPFLLVSKNENGPHGFGAMQAAFLVGPLEGRRLVNGFAFRGKTPHVRADELFEIRFALDVEVATDTREPVESFLRDQERESFDMLPVDQFGFDAGLHAAASSKSGLYLSWLSVHS